MKASLLHAFGGPEQFRTGEIPTPVAGPGQVLVRIAAASVNPVDTKIRASGAMAPALPAPLGCDMAGIVAAVGPGVAGFAPGDRVYGCVGGVTTLQGTYADYVAADARLLAPAPATLDLRQAAALPLVFITAWEGLVDRAAVQPGDTVLIHGGAGGVGHVAIQIAKSRGARVVATVSSPEKAEIARSLGADETVNYRDETVETYVQRLTGGTGFDVVFDATGGSDIATSFAAAKLNGQVVTIVSRYSADLSPMHQKGLSLHVVFMLLPMLHDAAGRLDRTHQGQVMRQATALAEAGRLTPLLDPARFTLDQVADAHRHHAGGKAVGKIVIDVAALD
ncbi:zinc-dependent alcohol dehydrogenase family protein [Oleisolibacter albus]|uniref:zinc-dependent alcohol dehydrogenase family protein n=1 Tax=Oleisolibacter albus TaxID=2171757 RepID=UPI000DF3EDD6|nr:zinc-dependent alcohol dehydrogenase family protein [Oleisolibacter albus]